VAPPLDKITTADGLSVAALKTGSGAQALLIPNRIYMQDHFASLSAKRTVVFFDPRNRGESEAVSDAAKLSRGVHHDAEDLEALRLHYGFTQAAILAHSYTCVPSVLYAMDHPDRVSHLILIGAPPPDAGKEYPPELKCRDAVLTSFYAQFTALQQQRAAMNDEVLCQKAWALLRTLYVYDAKDADRLGWAPCNIPNEVNFMGPFLKYIQPSLNALRFSDADFAKITMPVLVIHGRNDRSAPYGGGCDWTERLPNATLLTLDQAAHTPWIESPGIVFPAIESFLSS
jgi:proline iminopeptidase